VLVAGEGGGVVGEEGGDQLGTGAVGVGGDATDERQCVGGGGEDEFLAGLEAETDADGDFGEAVEFLVEGEGGEGVLIGGGGDVDGSEVCCRTHAIRVGGCAEDCK
jgi:hypothetical protein